MRPEEFLPASDGLEDLGLNGGVDILGHEQARDLEEELLGGYLTVECKFAAIGEVFEEVEAEKEDFPVLDTEAFGDAVDGVFGPAWRLLYMSTREFMMSRMLL